MNDMNDETESALDQTAVRVALWRAMHVREDPPPHILTDEIGLRLIAPDAGWMRRGDMHKRRTSRARASIVARARYIEDLVVEQSSHGVDQYLILGSGLDSFAQRKDNLAPGLKIFEVDQPGTIGWKERRLIELGYGLPNWLRFVPFDFNRGTSWWDAVQAAGFIAERPTVVASTGVVMYLPNDAVTATLRQLAALTPGSTIVMSFMLPLDRLESGERRARQSIEKHARAAGTPLLSFFTPEEMLALASEAGFRKVRHVSAAWLTQKYFAERSDGLRPSSAEELLVATV